MIPVASKQRFRFGGGDATGKEALREAILSVSLSSDFIKRNTGVPAVGCDAQSVAPVGGKRMEEFSNLFGGTTLKATVGNTRRPWAMLHFRPHLIFYHRSEQHE